MSVCGHVCVCMWVWVFKHFDTGNACNADVNSMFQPKPPPPGYPDYMQQPQMSLKSARLSRMDSRMYLLTSIAINSPGGWGSVNLSTPVVQANIKLC